MYSFSNAMKINEYGEKYQVSEIIPVTEITPAKNSGAVYGMLADNTGTVSEFGRWMGH